MAPKRSNTARDKVAENSSVDAWPQRSKKRQSGIDAVHGSVYYATVEDLLRQELLDQGSLPQPPRPDDPGLSKRAWEEAMFLWRRKLHCVCAIHSVSAARKYVAGGGGSGGSGIATSASLVDPSTQ